MSIHDQNIIIRSLFSLFCGNSRALSVVLLRWRCSILYNYPPKGRWIFMVYWDAKRRGIYPALFTDPEGDSCFSIYRISCIKMKQVTFCCVMKMCMKIIFYLPVNTDKPKFVASLVFVCTTASFIAENHLFRKCLETRRHLGSGCKTLNSQGYSELREPIKRHENCYSLIW